ncbi:MAG: deoxyguanosinetriphosphate triphosphohydrolase, partial [Marmoricola sp.]
WERPEGGGKFGVYEDDLRVFEWLRKGVDGPRRCIEAQVMDFADDVAYSVHDLEDGIVGGHIDLAALDSTAELSGVWDTVRDWYLPAATDDELGAALGRVRAVGGWPQLQHGSYYDGSRAALATLKNLTSDLIGVFCGSVHTATRDAFGQRALVRHEADLVEPDETRLEIAVLKGIAAHYVMRSDARVAAMEQQRGLVQELFAALADSDGALLDESLQRDYSDAADDRARLRVVVDQVASLTDASAVAWHQRLCR